MVEMANVLPLTRRELQFELREKSNHTTMQMKEEKTTNSVIWSFVQNNKKENNDLDTKSIPVNLGRADIQKCQI